MKFLYVTDLHGDVKKYEKCLDLAKAAGLDLIVNGGDMLPKTGGTRKVTQPEFIGGYLDDYFSRLQELGITYVNMLGNDDLVEMDPLFERLCSKYDNVHNIAGKKVKIDGYEFIGMNNILDGPFRSKERVVYEKGFVMEDQLSDVAVRTSREGVDEEIADWEHYLTTNLELMEDILDDLPEPEDPKKTVYVTHTAPAGLHLGEVSRLNRDVGSWDIRRFFEEKQPLLTLHGHIHESPFIRDGVWKTKLGETTCIQPGQTERGENTMLGCLVDLDKQEYEWIRTNV